MGRTTQRGGKYLFVVPKEKYNTTGGRNLLAVTPCKKGKDQDDDNDIASSDCTYFHCGGTCPPCHVEGCFNAAMNMAPPRHVEVICFDATQKNVESKKSVGSITIISEYIIDILEKTCTLLGE